MFYETIPYIKETSARIVLGGDSFGASISKQDSFRLMDEYFSAGGNHIDTAHLYGVGSEGGEEICEKTIGAWLNTRSNRHRVLLSTKGAHPDLSAMHKTRVKKKEIEKDLKESLSALHTDYIDLYWLHRDDPTTPAGEILEWMNDFFKEGLILSFGASNWTAARLREAEEYQKEHHIRGFAASQILFSAAHVNDIGMTDDTLVWMTDAEAPYYMETDTPLFCYSSQAKGYFAKWAAGREISGLCKDWFDTAESRRRAGAIMKIARERGVSVSAIALSYLWSVGVNAFPIVGCKNSEQLKDSLTAKDLTLCAEETQAIKGGYMI